MESSTQTKVVSWNEVETVFDRLKEVISCHFTHDSNIWSKLNDWATIRSHFWKTTQEATIKAYLSFVRVRLVCASNNKDESFPLLPQEVLQDLHKVGRILIRGITERKLRDVEMECFIRAMTGKLKAWKNARIKVKDSVPVVSKPEEIVDSVVSKDEGEKHSGEKSKRAFERPKHPYPEVGTTLWVPHGDSLYERAEVIPGKLVKARHDHDRVILILTGEGIGGFSRHPSTIVRFLTGGNHPNGWNIIQKKVEAFVLSDNDFRSDDTDDSKISVNAHALIKSGECYRIMPESVKKPGLDSVVAHLPVIPVPDKAMLIPVDIPRKLTMLKKDEAKTEDEVLPSDTVLETPDTESAEKVLSPDAKTVLQQVDARRKEIERELRELAQTEQAIGEIPAYEKSLREKREAFDRLKSEFVSASERIDHEIWELEVGMETIMKKASKLSPG